MESREEARCHISDEEWMKSRITVCELEHPDCEENRHCRERAQQEQFERSELCG